MRVQYRTEGYLQLFISVLLLLSGYGFGLLSTVGFSHRQLLQVSIKSLADVKANSTVGGSACSRSSRLKTANVNVTDPAAAANSFQDRNNSTESLPSPSPQPVRTPCAGTPPTILTQQSGNALITHSELDHVWVEGPTACEKGAAKGLQLAKSSDLVAPIVVFGHRVNYLARSMMGLLKYWMKDPTNTAKFPLFVSIDGGDQRSLAFAAAWKETAGVQVISRVQDPAKCKNADCNLTAHVRMLLQLFSRCLQSPRLIILEEDLEVSPDFLSYFAATAPLLAQDSSLWCVSAWNDHGQKGRAVNSTALYRTDILPGLGWMITRDHALPLLDKWPELYWDDWMRKPEIRQGHQCIFPEVSRTYHFAKTGAHVSGDFFSKFLANIALNSEDIDWFKQDLSYLLKDNYAALMHQWLGNATVYDSGKYGNLQAYCDVNQPAQNSTSDLVVSYPWRDSESDHKAYRELARKLPGMIGDIQGNRPRSSYDGVVMVRCRGRRLFLRPASASL